ncbi:dTDP-4-dehydrorhamnose reductase [Aestuariibius insulae]|uniref:dTDP-4-dehydrorhamnose reductase n=1 Tax=Aestuariibius insulae TaxID=2058287 RepID=UPI00345E67EB
MKVLCFGRSGQVATELRALDVEALGRDQVDFAQTAEVWATAERAPADVWINAAAWTAVDAAEEHEAEARQINCVAVEALAEVAAKRGIPLVHLSTDYVFDGSGERPWRPEDRVDPLGAYGRTKLAGENAVREAGGTHAVLRTSWVFSATGSNFVKSMLRLGAERDSLRIVADQVGGPTSAASIAAACLEVARQLVDAPDKSGTYHFAGVPDVSWAGFAREIFDAAGMDVAVEEIPTSGYPTPAARPLNSRLDCSATERVFGIARPDWREDLRAVLADLKVAA